MSDWRRASRAEPGGAPEPARRHRFGSWCLPSTRRTLKSCRRRSRRRRTPGPLRRRRGRSAADTRRPLRRRRSGRMEAQSPPPWRSRRCTGSPRRSRRTGLAPAIRRAAAGQFFVGAEATQGIGVIATVASFAPPSGRSGVGASVVSYPPLTVRTFDGGVPVSYVYVTFADAISNSSWSAADTKNRSASSSQVQAPNQVQLGSLDGGSTWSVVAPPSAPGAIGYTDARDWWWIGSGEWSTSSDGGTTWTPYRNAGVPLPLPGSLQVLDPRHAWFGAMAGTRALLENTNDGGTHWQMSILLAINQT